MIKEHKASLNTPSKLDIDYLFDNFNKFCKVEISKGDLFKEKPSGHKIIKNLTSTFDLVAM